MAEKKRSGTRGSLLKKRTPEQKKQAKEDKAERRQRRNTRKQIALDKSAARVRRYDAKTKAREKAGGAGVSIVFYEIVMPDGNVQKVEKRECGKRKRT